MEIKTGTREELEKDIAECGFHEMSVADMVKDGICPPDVVGQSASSDLDVVLANARLQLDNAMQEILRQSGLPLYLFDLLIDSVQKDIRKADADILRTQQLQRKEDK